MYEVVGFRKCSGTKNGRPYSGAYVHFTFEERGVEGVATFNRYIPSDMLDPVIGQRVFLNFSSTGYLLGVEVVS